MFDPLIFLGESKHASSLLKVFWAVTNGKKSKMKSYKLIDVQEFQKYTNHE